MLINENIPKQNFEIIKETIASILFLELEHQRTLKSLPNETKVFLERSSAFQQSEVLMINVLLDSANYSFSTQSLTEGSTVYFIDLYTTGKSTSTATGGEASAIERDLYLGMIRYVLTSTKYKTLNLPNGAISGTSLDSFENFNSSENEANSVKICRITFSVRINENQNLWDGLDVSNMFTDIRLKETNQGYRYERQE